MKGALSLFMQPYSGLIISDYTPPPRGDSQERNRKMANQKDRNQERQDQQGKKQQEQQGGAQRQQNDADNERDRNRD